MICNIDTSVNNRSEINRKGPPRFILNWIGTARDLRFLTLAVVPVLDDPSADNVTVAVDGALFAKFNEAGEIEQLTPMIWSIHTNATVLFWLVKGVTLTETDAV